MEGLSVHQKGARLLLADDHAIFAEALRVYLEKTHTVVGLVRDGRAMLAEAMRLRPDVIVVDVGMPLLNGLDAGRKIHLQQTTRPTRRQATGVLQRGNSRIHHECCKGRIT